MAANEVGFYLLCHCGVQVFISEHAIARFQPPREGVFAVGCPLCGEELYRFTQTTNAAVTPAGDQIPPSLEVREYHAKQGKRWETP